LSQKWNKGRLLFPNLHFVSGGFEGVGNSGFLVVLKESAGIPFAGTCVVVKTGLFGSAAFEINDSVVAFHEYSPLFLFASCILGGDPHQLCKGCFFGCLVNVDGIGMGMDLASSYRIFISLLGAALLCLFPAIQTSVGFWHGIPPI
jgi:hypothetical protein